nr:MAG TPA: hypothetical protein [Caudoviricetes sp.]
MFFNRPYPLPLFNCNQYHYAKIIVNQLNAYKQ